MGTLEVLFEVPAFIEHGLALGTYERVGGIIRDAASKQVVGWLRDGTIANTAGQLLSTAANPLSGVLQAALTAAKGYDNFMTRNTINALGSQITANHLTTMTAINHLGASLQMVTAVSSLTLAGQLLNLSLSTATLITINKRLDAMSNQLASMEAKILAEFDQDRNARFETTLEDAKDVFESRNAKIRDEAHRSAINGLSEARKHFMFNFEKALSPQKNQLAIAQHFLIKAMYAEITRIQCYIAMDDHETAINRFKETLPVFKLATIRLIRAWLGNGSAIYLHKDLVKRNMIRFLEIQQWLKNDEAQANLDDMYSILDDLRSQFWDKNVLDDNNIFKKMTWWEMGLDDSQKLLLANNLFQAELLIENYERLLSFELEIREARLANVYIDEAELEAHGAALIIDHEVLQRLQ